MGERLLTTFASAAIGGFALLRKLLGAGTGRHWRRVAGLVLAAGFVVQLCALWHPVYRFTGLLQVDKRYVRTMLPALREQPVALNLGGYDGQYYAQIACDPSLRDPALRQATDSLSYRARRILMPVAAWVLGLGRSEWIIQLYPWLNIACWFALGWVLWPLLQADQRWLGLMAWAGVLFSAGALASVRYSLTDLPALLLLLLAWRAAGAERMGRMTAWLGAAVLARETMLAGAWGLCPKPWDKPRGMLRWAGWIGLALLPFVLWLVYVRWQVGGASGGARNFIWPGAGLVVRWREAWSALGMHDDRWLAWASFFATVSVTAQLVFLFLRWEWENRWWRLGAGFGVLALLLGTAVWEGFPGASPRVLLPLLVACNALALQRRWSLAWLLVLNLSVPIGLMELSATADERELAAVRAGNTAAVLRAGKGCYGPEHLGDSVWVWTEQTAHWKLRFWSASPGAEALVTTRVRSLDERELVISWKGGELWRGRVTPGWTNVRLAPIPCGPASVDLTLQADRPSVREGPGADARLFSVCLLEPTVEFRARPTEPAAGE